MWNYACNKKSVRDGIEAQQMRKKNNNNNNKLIKAAAAKSAQ